MIWLKVSYSYQNIIPRNIYNTEKMTIANLFSAKTPKSPANHESETCKNEADEEDADCQRDADEYTSETSSNKSPTYSAKMNNYVERDVMQNSPDNDVLSNHSQSNDQKDYHSDQNESEQVINENMANPKNTEPIAITNTLSELFLKQDENFENFLESKNEKHKYESDSDER